MRQVNTLQTVRIQVVNEGHPVAEEQQRLNSQITRRIEDPLSVLGRHVDLGVVASRRLAQEDGNSRALYDLIGINTKTILHDELAPKVLDALERTRNEKLLQPSTPRKVGGELVSNDGRAAVQANFRWPLCLNACGCGKADLVWVASGRQYEVVLLMAHGTIRLADDHIDGEARVAGHERSAVESLAEHHDRVGFERPLKVPAVHVELRPEEGGVVADCQLHVLVRLLNHLKAGCGLVASELNIARLPHLEGGKPIDDLQIADQLRDATSQAHVSVLELHKAGSLTIEEAAKSIHAELAAVFHECGAEGGA